MTPRGLRNNNPLNIRHNRNNRWQGTYEQQTDPEFVRFASMQFGIRAGFVILRNYIKQGHKDVASIISRWAPSNENDTEAYIRHVCVMSLLSPFQPLCFEDKDTMVALVGAMIRVECGKPVDQKIIEQAYGMAK